MLTIAIPTYNRNEILLRNIRRLLPQLTSECKLIIFDNFSDVPVEQTLSNELTMYTNLNLKIYRNRINIGGNANILRCFEYCDTEFLWILGDDDIISENAITIILNRIRNNPNAVFFHFNSAAHSHVTRNKDKVTVGLQEFIDNMNLGEFMFISISVYNISRVRHNLNYGNHYQYTCAGHLLVLLLSIKERDECYLSSEYLVLPEDRLMQYYTFGSMLHIVKGLPLLLEAPLPVDCLIALKKKMKDTVKYSLRPERAIIQILSLIVEKGEEKEAKYLYRVISKRYLLCDSSLTMRAKLLLFRLFLIKPEFFYKLIMTVHARIKGEVKSLLHNYHNL